MEKKKAGKRSPAEIYNERASQPDFCPLSDISDYLILLILKAEDKTFYAHHGINIYSIRICLRAFRKTGKLPSCSTITQQLVKNLYFTFEKSWIRKLREAVLALRFEHRLSKDQILELYLNLIHFGNGQYGIGSASRFYFGKTPKELTFNQSIFLAFLPPVAGVYNPLYHPEKYAAYRYGKLQGTLGDCALYEYVCREIRMHGADSLDEELCHASKETDRYNGFAPLINERFGPGMPECLLYK